MCHLYLPVEYVLCKINSSEEISLDSNYRRVKIHYSVSVISSGSLDIHSKKSDH